MTIELRNIQIHDRMSEETTAFTASLYIDNKKIGWAKNTGQGGCTTYGADDHKDYALIKEAEAYCEGLPPNKFEYDGTSYENPASLEVVIDRIIDEYLVEKENKKLKKRMLTHIMFGNQSQYTEVHWTGLTIEQMLAAPVGREKIKSAIRSLKKKTKDGDTLLNTNIPEELL